MKELKTANKPYFSIIIPIYNREKFLKKCLESVQCQEFENFECILIDDGSTDSSLEICEKMEDERFKVISQLNKGVSSARNRGLEIAVGEYIIFIDSDDYVSSNHLKILVDNLLNNEFDIIFNEIKIIRAGHEEESDFGKFLLSELVVSNYESIKLCLLENGFEGYLVNKIFKNKLVQKQNIRFNENIRWGEDLLFTIEYLLIVEKATKIINQPTYHYVFHDKNATAIGNQMNHRLFSLLETNQILYDKLSSLSKEFEELTYQRLFLYTLLVYYKSKKFKYSNEVMKKLLIKIKSEKKRGFMVIANLDKPNVVKIKNLIIYLEILVKNVS